VFHNPHISFPKSALRGYRTAMREHTVFYPMERPAC